MDFESPKILPPAIAVAYVTPPFAKHACLQQYNILTEFTEERDGATRLANRDATRVPVWNSVAATVANVNKARGAGKTSERTIRTVS
ncbi:hypothetical protein TNCV_2483361 [Trichonephila clavipes]|uniref:Uncharacterized protein n=1 Tax=Trichonephila clavipes TaxID=2585209 RepID=A0A8X7BAP0_TRICX|nr:hypothetical protein TNCV_2483361 [Trichonephila clavipes]